MRAVLVSLFCVDSTYRIIENSNKNSGSRVWGGRAYIHEARRAATRAPTPLHTTLRGRFLPWRGASRRGRGGVERGRGPCGCPPCLLGGRPWVRLIRNGRQQG